MYTFNTTPRLVIGANKLQHLGALLSDLGIKNPLIVTGPNLVKNQNNNRSTEMGRYC